MKKQIISIVITSTMLAGTVNNAYANDPNTSDDKHKKYIGTGIGAVAGALFAGPVGFVAGGLIGNIAAKHGTRNSSQAEQAIIANESPALPTTQVASDQATENLIDEAIVVAQNGEFDSVINDDVIDQSSALTSVLINDVGLDVFFLSGSTNVEPFFKSRIQAMTRLMQEIPDIDVHLEGYSDRRGDKDKNLALANERLGSVRSELLQAGVDVNRIHLSAFGEQAFLSKPGDLEAYTFDRRVVIRFESSTLLPKSPVALMETPPAP